MAKELPKIKATTQEHLDIENIRDDFMIFKTGWVGMVLAVSSVNFELLSETEQDASIYAYGAFLNSLTFPVQVLIRTKKADVTSYFAHLEEAENSQTNPDLKKQIQMYKEFIASIVSQKTILDKKFYIIINYSPLEKGLKGIGKAKVSKTKEQKQLIVDAQASLLPKRDHIIKQMGRIGLSVRQITTKELVELFYDIYNPAPTGTQRIILDTSSYTNPIVEPAVAIPTEALAVPVTTPPVAGQQPPSSQGNIVQPAHQANQGQAQVQTNNPPADKPSSDTQAEALKGLQNATAKAAQHVSGNSQMTQPAQTQNNQNNTQGVKQ